MKLYHAARSGNAFKARLLLSLLGLEHEIEDVDLAAGDNRTEAFLELNPRGQIPVLVDGARVIWDSQAILVYLARRHGGEDWLPTDADGMAQVMQWLAVAENELLFGLARARAVIVFGRAWHYDQSKALGEAGLKVLDDRLARRLARTLDIPLTGTLGVLLDGKRAGLVDNLTPLIDQLQSLGFRLAPHTRRAVLELAGEGLS